MGMGSQYSSGPAAGQGCAGENGVGWPGVRVASQGTEITVRSAQEPAETSDLRCSGRGEVGRVEAGRGGM